jgi:hypothetical protein
MKSYHLGGGYHDAYMAGQYKADREHYMNDARRVCQPALSVVVKAAREAHHHYMRFLSSALKESNARTPKA